MADRKITDLTALAAGSQATGDLLTIVDVSEGAATDKNKKITVESLFKGIPGDVGIKTASPGYTLHVNGSGSTSLGVTTSSGSSEPQIRLEDTAANDFFTLQKDGRALTFKPQGSEAMRIDSSGRVLVGTSSGSGEPIAAFQGRSNDASDSGIVAITRTGTNPSGSIGELRFATGSDFNKYYGMIICASDGSTSSTSLPGVLRFSTTASGSTSPTERMRIDSEGTIKHTGLRNGDEENKLAYYTVPSHDNDQEDVLVFSVANESSSNQITFGGGPSAFNCATQIVFRTASAVDTTVGSERLRIGPNGHLYNTCSDNSNTSLTLRKGSAGDAVDFLQCRSSSNAEKFTIKANGNAENVNGTYTSISDAKLKENIVDASSQWDDIKAIQIRNWNFKEETGHETHTQIGVVAQELETVCPGLVSESPDRDEEGNDLGTVTKSVKQSILYMKAVKALQEAMNRIETLEAKVAALEAQ